MLTLGNDTEDQFTIWPKLTVCIPYRFAAQSSDKNGTAVDGYGPLPNLGGKTKCFPIGKEHSD